MQFLKQSTAWSCIVGPIYDAAGGEFTTAVIGDLSISKNGGTPAAMASAATLTHVANGAYILAGTTGNSDTLGRIDIYCNRSTYQMKMKEFSVLVATAFDSLITDGNIANTTNILDLANAIESGVTLRQLLRLVGAVLAGKTSGDGVTSKVFRNIGDTKDRVTATISSGNRSGITVDGT